MRLIAYLSLFFSLAACSPPDLQGQKWRCKAAADCGAGYQCDSTASHCVPAYQNKNGVFPDRLLFGMSAAIGDDVSLGQVGRAALAGLGACFTHVNATGGVHGRTLELLVRNDSYNPQKTAANVEELLGDGDRKVFALTGVIGTATSLVARERALKKRVLFFGPATGHDSFEPDPPDRYVFNVRPRYSQEAAQLAEYLLKNARPKIPAQNIALFGQGLDAKGSLDGFGKSGFLGLAAALQKEAQLDEDAITKVSYDAAKTTDVAIAVASIVRWLAAEERAKGKDGAIPAAIVMVALYDAAAAMIRGTEDLLAAVRRGEELPKTLGAFRRAELERLKRVELRFATLSTVGSGLSAALKSFGQYESTDGVSATRVKRAYGQGTIMALPVPHYASSASGVLRYREHLRKHLPDGQAGFVSLEAYITGMLLVEGLRKHGPDLTTESFVETLETLSVDLGIGTTLTFSKNDHQAASKLWGARLGTGLEFEAIGVLLDQAK